MKKYLRIAAFLLCAVAARAQHDTVKIAKLLDKAYGYEAAEPQKALALYRQSFALSEKARYPIGAFKSLQYSGIVQASIGQYDSAIYYYNKSKPYAKSAAYLRGEGQTYTNLANTYQFKGDYDKTIAYYLKGISIFEKIQDSAALSQSYQNLSALYDNIKNPKLELLYLEKAIPYSTAAGNEQLGLLYSDIGTTHLQLNQPEKAKSYFEKTSALQQKDGSPRLLFFERRNWGEYYNHLRQYEKAIPFYEAAEKLQTNDVFQQNDLSHVLSTLYLNMKKYSRALAYAQKAQATAEQIGSKEFRVRSLVSLSRIYNALGQAQNAFDALEAAQPLKDSLLTQKHIEEMTLLQTRFETAKKDQALRDKELKLLKKERQSIYQFIAITALALLALSIWIFARLHRRKREAELENLKQEQEIRQLEALIEGEEKERKRVAQELHDGLNGDLSAIKYRISGLEDYEMKPLDKEELSRIVDMIDQSCQQVRNISHNLMPASISEFGLVEALRQYLRKMGAVHGLDIDFQTYGNEIRLPEKAETTLFRIVQELINNTAKHAKASRALVQLNFHENELSLTVEDDGTGFYPRAQPDGLGLRNIRSRVGLLDGQLDISSTPAGSSFNMLFDLNQIRHD